MYRIDDASAATELPTPEAALAEGYWTEGNPGTGVAATLVRASFLNMVQEELRAVVVAAGLTPSKTTYNQVLTAIQTVLQKSPSSYAVATGTANAHTIALTPALTARTDGMLLRYKAPAANTSAVTLTDGVGTVAVIGSGHAPLQGGEYIANGDALVVWNSTINSGTYILLECTGGALQVAPAVAAGQAVQLGQLAGQYIGSLQVLSSVSLTAAMATFTVGGRSVQATTARFRGQVAGGGGGGALPTGAGQASAGGGGNAGNPFEFVVSGITFPVSITVGAPGTGSLGVAGTFGVTGGDLVVGSYATIKGGLGGPVGGLVGAFPAFNGLSGQGSNPSSTFAAGVKVLNDGIGQVGNISTLLSASAVSPGQGGTGPYGSVALGSGGTSGYGVGGVAALNGVSSGSGKQGGTAQPALLMIDFYS